MKIEEAIAESLPNWPKQVIKEFLAPFAEDRGWPPHLGPDGTPTNKWRKLFNNRRPMARIERRSAWGTLE